MKIKVLITGASGFIGGKIVDSLARDEDISLHVLLRNPDAQGPFLEKGVQVHMGDITRPDTIRDALGQKDIIIHCAALMSNYDMERKEKFYEVNVLGTENLLKMADRKSLRQFIHISSVGVYGATGNRPVTENAPYGRILSAYEWSKKESELIVLKCAKEADIPFTILRLSQVYGTPMRYGWPETIRSIKRGAMLIPGHASAKIHLLNIGDFVNALRLVLDNGRAMNSTYNVAGPQILGLGEVFDTISDILHVKRPARVPYMPVYLASLFLNLVPNLLKTRSLRLLTPHRVRFFAEDHVYDTSRLRGDLGYLPRVKVRDGFEEMIAWCVPKEVR